MKKWVWWLVIVVMVSGSIFFYQYQKRNAARQALQKASNYVTARVERRDLDVTISGNGNVCANDERNIRPGVSGKISRILVEEGDVVKGGEPLIILSNDTLEVQLKQAELSLQLARENLEFMLGPAGAKAKNQLQLKQAEANLNSLEEQVEDLSIESPIQGQIWSLEVSEGDTVKPGDLVAIIADTSSYKVVAKVKQADLSKIQVNDPVMIHAGSDIPPTTGRIESVSEEGSKAGKDVEFEVEVTVSEADPKLRPGMAVTVTYNPSEEIFLSMPGTVMAMEKENVIAEVEGTVSDILVDEGATVKAGETIVMLENESLMVSYEIAKNTVQEARQDLAVTESQIAQQNLQVEQAETDLKDKKDLVDKLVVRSPIDGKVISANVNVGDDVSSNQVVLTVADTTPLIITVPVDELDVVNVFPGQSAKVEIDAFPDSEFEATVRKIAEQGQVREGIANYDVDVEFFSEEVKLGMSGTVTIYVSQKKNVLTVPIEAINWEKNQAYVYKLKDGNLEKTKIKVGVQNDMYAEVLSGLEEGEVVVTAGIGAGNLDMRFPGLMRGMNRPLPANKPR